jgi:hypothetical protein
VLDPEKFRDEWLTEKSFQVRMSKDKSVQKDWCWPMRLVYDPRELSEVITTRPRVTEMLHLVCMHYLSF